MKIHFKMTPNLKSFFYLFLMALFFFGCEKETQLESAEILEEHQESPLSITIVGNDEIEENQGLFEHLQSFNYKAEGVKTSNEHDFTIDTYHVSHIVNTEEDYESYTFPIYRDEFNPNKLENLLVSVYPNDVFNAILVTYGKEEGEDTFSKVIGIEQIQNSEGLFSKLTQTCVNVAHECCAEGNHSDGRNPDGSKCPAHSVCYSRFCTSGGGESPTVIPTYSNTGNTSGGTGGRSSSGPAGEITTETVSPAQKIANEIGNSLLQIEGAMSWLFNFDNRAEVDAINTYLTENGCYSENGCSDAVKDFITPIINSGVDNILVTAFPFVKYPPNSNYDIHYPKLTEYLKNQLPKTGDIPLIVETIKLLTGLSENQIKEDLKWGKGPTIHITQLDDFGTTTNEKTAGYFEPSEPDVLHIDIDYVNKLENSTATQYEKDSFLFYLGTTILHEYVHYGDFQDGVDYPGEEGKLFEILVYGEDVGSENAAIILNRE